METELTTSTESTVGGIRNANVSAVPPKPTVIFYLALVTLLWVPDLAV